jgi:hypothetical protein
MNRRFLNYTFYIIIVFVQVFFVDNFEFKIGLIFIPLLNFLFKKDTQSLFFYSILLFISYDFFKNNFVGFSLIVFLFTNFVVDQMSKLWGNELVLNVKFISIFVIFYIFSYGLLSEASLINFIIITSIFIIRKVVNSGYFRFN